MIEILLLIIAFAVAPVFMCWLFGIILALFALAFIWRGFVALITPPAKRGRIATRSAFFTRQHVANIDMTERVRRARAEIDWSSK